MHSDAEKWRLAQAKSQMEVFERLSGLKIEEATIEEFTEWIQKNKALVDAEMKAKEREGLMGE